MRRLPRILWTVASAASFLLFLSTLALWIRSYHATDALIHRGHRVRQLSVAHGRLFFQSVGRVERVSEWHARPNPAPTGPPRPLIVYVETPGSDTEWKTDRGDVRKGLSRTSGDPAQIPPTLVPSRTLGGPPQTSTPDRFWPGTQTVSDLLIANQSFREAKVNGKIETQEKGSERLLTGRTIWIPFWMIAAATAVLPARSVRRILANRRCARRAGMSLCPACGYDLRATPDRCPECGIIAASLHPPERRDGGVTGKAGLATIMVDGHGNTEPLALVRDMLSRHMGVPAARITGVSRLAEDLGMSGDDAVEFMRHFFHEFNVDARAFDFERYFLGEYFDPIEFLSPPRQSIDVNHLLKCLRQKKWTDPEIQ